MLKDAPAFSGFSVNDIAAAKEFYSHKLGLQVTDEPNGLTLHTSGGRNTLVYPKENHVPATYTTLNFVVADIDSSVEEMIAQGIGFEHYNDPQMPQDDKGILRGLSARMGPDIAWFRDPAGNILSVLQEK